MAKAPEKPGQETGGKKNAGKAVEKFLAKAEKAAKRGDYAEAASAYQEAARLAEPIGDRRAVDFCVEEAKCNAKLGKDFNAGWSYKCAAVYSLSSSDFNNAVVYAGKAIEHFLKADSMYAVQWCYNLIGQAAEKKGDNALALESYTKSLEIGYSEEIDERIRNLSGHAACLFVEQKCGKDVAKEGEKIDVFITIRNDMKEPASGIKVLGEKSNELESIASLLPGEAKTFRYRMAAFEDAKTPFREVVWKDAKGARMSRLIEPVGICVIPNIEAKPCISDRMQVGKKSLFVVLVSNNSKQPISDIDIELQFPVELKVRPVTGYSMDRIGPGEEKGFVFSILPMTVGKTMLKPSIIFQDSYGRRYVKKLEAFALEESLPLPGGAGIKTADTGRPAEKGDLYRLKYTEKFKRYVESVIRPKEMDEAAYVKLAKQMHSATKGYTLKDVDIETVSGHVMEECRSFALAGEHSSENHRLFLFSGESRDSPYLLTVVIKDDDGLVNVAFRLYSDREEELEDLVEKIADIVEYTVIAMSLATEIQKIEVRETINIVDSIVQRSKIGERIRKKDKSVDVKDSVVQRTYL
jgi:tetratricopeptide (TPR) repeat protein